eukprot:gene4121-751_t
MVDVAIMLERIPTSHRVLLLDLDMRRIGANSSDGRILLLPNKRERQGYRLVAEYKAPKKRNLSRAASSPSFAESSSDDMDCPDQADAIRDLERFSPRTYALPATSKQCPTQIKQHHKTTHSLSLGGEGSMGIPVSAVRGQGQLCLLGSLSAKVVLSGTPTMPAANMCFGRQVLPASDPLVEELQDKCRSLEMDRAKHTELLLETQALTENLKKKEAQMATLEKRCNDLEASRAQATPVQEGGELSLAHCLATTEATLDSSRAAHEQLKHDHEQLKHELKHEQLKHENELSNVALLFQSEVDRMQSDQEHAPASGVCPASASDISSNRTALDDDDTLLNLIQFVLKLENAIKPDLSASAVRQSTVAAVPQPQ